MSLKPMSAGSEFPPLKPGVLRIYSSPICPYAQRTRILMAHRKIEHETVNIDLTSKPEWYAEKVNPLSKVPSIQKDDTIIYDSAIVNDYLDATYPGEKLTPSDPYQQAKDRMFVEVMAQVVGPFYKIFLSGLTNLEAAPMLFNGLDLVEKELKARNTPFFGGENISMLDVLLFPHLVRASMLGKLAPELALDNDRFQLFTAWLDAMRTVPAIQETELKETDFKNLIDAVKMRMAKK